MTGTGDANAVGANAVGANTIGANAVGAKAAEAEGKRAHHDMGGATRFLCEPIDTEPHGLSDFDREVDAIRGILGAKGVMSVDQLRRAIEAIPEEDYLRLSYYQKWIRAIADNLLTNGVVTEAELGAALEAGA